MKTSRSRVRPLPTVLLVSLLASTALAAEAESPTQPAAHPGPVLSRPPKPESVDVFDHGAVGDGVHDDAPALAAAVDAAVKRGTPAVVVSRKIWLRSHVGWGHRSSAAARAPVTYVIPRGGGFHVAATGADLELVGDLQAGPYQIFFGETPRWTGSTAFANGTVLPEWWGAQGDGVTDDTAAITQAIALTRGDVLFRPVTYLVKGAAGSDLFGFQAKRMTGQRYGAVGGTVIKVSSESGVLNAVFRALTAKVELRDLLVDANGRAAHGILLDGAHGSILENVGVTKAASHGFLSTKAMNCAWSNVSATQNGGDGIRLDDSNATRVTAAFTTLNAGHGISVRSTYPASGAASAGVTLVAPDLEVDGAGGILISGTTSVSTIINPWIEAGAVGDALRLDNAKHVTVFGGRFTGIGNGTNRAIRIGASSSGIGLFGVRLRAGLGDANYESIEVEEGATAVTAVDALIMVQRPGDVARSAPVTGPSAAQAWTGRAEALTDSTARDLDALRADHNALLSRLRAAGVLATPPTGRAPAGP